MGGFCTVKEIRVKEGKPMRKFTKWLKKIKWWFYPDVVGVRAFIEQDMGLEVKWDDQYKIISVKGKQIQKNRFLLHPDWHYYGYPRDIIRSLKNAGINW
jgi:hypothetical protein